jgi:hypothetical protein
MRILAVCARLLSHKAIHQAMSSLWSEVTLEMDRVELSFEE